MVKKMNCLSIQREEKLWTYIWKREKENPMPTAEAGAQCRVPVPSRSSRHRGKPGRQGQARPTGASQTARGKLGRQGQARPMGASEAGGGRRDRWGQARLVGAGEANGGRKPPGQIPSQHSPFGPLLSKWSKTKQKKQTKI